eukprot:6905547-Prymnesium_polylepis.1
MAFVRLRVDGRGCGSANHFIWGCSMGLRHGSPPAMPDPGLQCCLTASFEAQLALAGKGMAEHELGCAMSASAMVASARSEIGARFCVD